MPPIDRTRCIRRALVALTLIVGAAIPIGPVAGGAAGQQGATPPRLAGAFVQWGAKGREQTLQIWERWLKQKPSSVIGVDFYADSTWDDFHRWTWVPALWNKLNPARIIVWSVPLTMKGTPLADVANGLHDAEFEAAARAIAEAQPRAIIRLGWEMNLEQMAWFAGGHEADYIAAFRRVAAIFRRYSGDFRFDWCPGWGPQQAPADRAYPGDDVVDYVGLDVYDFKYEGPVEERWTSFYLKAPFGLEWQRDFAAGHGKHMSYPEWGVGQAGDDPLFIERMHAWFMQNQDMIAYAAYFDVDGMWPTRIDNNRFPQSQQLFKELFAGR